mgnify:CR=1 FL=1
MKIAIIDTGYVSLVLGVYLAGVELKHAGMITEKEKIDIVNKGQSPIYEPGLKEIGIIRE